jgi:uncharacterized phage protein (TIGR01671 family)
MREILFRGKRIDSGKWIYGMPCATEQSGIYAIQTLQGGIFDITLETVGQFTGMTDKNGKKIFEGDILNCITSDFDGSDKYVYNFKITDITDYEQMGFLDFCYEIEIISNIHDNPELLKEGVNNGCIHRM